MRIFFLPSFPHLYHGQDHHFISRSLNLISDWCLYPAQFLSMNFFFYYYYIFVSTYMGLGTQMCLHVEMHAHISKSRQLVRVTFSFHHVRVMNSESGMGKPKFLLLLWGRKVWGWYGQVPVLALCIFHMKMVHWTLMWTYTSTKVLKKKQQCLQQ